MVFEELSPQRGLRLRLRLFNGDYKYYSAHPSPLLNKARTCRLVRIGN